MKVSRLAEAQSYAAPGHSGMVAFRLHDGKGSPTDTFWTGLSILLPGGSAEKAAAPSEKVYVVVEGEIVVIFDDEEVTLGAFDTLYIEPNRSRRVENRSKSVCKMLVISPN